MPMYRYIALMWGHSNLESARAAKFLAARLHEVSPHKWSQAWYSAGLTIYHSGEHQGRMQTYRLQGERGAVLGRLFRNDFTSVVDDFDELESRRCLTTKGQHLIDNYWGRYVAFLNEPSSRTRYVMRDPSGAFPCFHTPFQGVTIYFSDMQDAANFDCLPFTVNWESLNVEIMLPGHQKTITGLNEVGEVLPAECVEVTPFDQRCWFVWNPTEISQTDVIENPEEAANILRRTVKSTIGALAGCYEHVAHNLGGLDSSIALACMVQAPKRPKITCVNFYTKSPRGEERRFSRQAAEQYGVPLVEFELDYRSVELDKLFVLNKRANPTGIMDCTGITGKDLQLELQKNVEARFTGVGGDNVFHQSPFGFGALDFVRSNGLLRKYIVKIALEASRYGRQAIFANFREMIRERLSPAPCQSYVFERLHEDRQFPFVNSEIVEDKTYERLLHPLLVADNHDLKGKYLQIMMSTFYYTGYYDRWDTEYHAEHIHAYFSQPIVETCLRIPIWILTYGGVDRGLARKAFQDDLPPSITRRYSKSTPADFFRAIFEHNNGFLRDVLLDGAMVGQGVLVRDRIEQALSSADQSLHVNHFQFLNYAAREIWLNGWLNRPTTKSPMLGISV